MIFFLMTLIREGKGWLHSQFYIALSPKAMRAETQAGQVAHACETSLGKLRQGDCESEASLVTSVVLS